LLQTAERKISGELGDESGTAPVGAKAARIDRGYVAEAAGSERTGERAAVTLVEIGVVVTQIQGEDLPGKAETNVPGVVVLVRNAVRKDPSCNAPGCNQC